MDWLVALLILLGLAAAAGLVWLHAGRAPVELSRRRASREVSESFSHGAEPSELSIAVSYLRRRASHYRELAIKMDDAVGGARCWDLASLFDRAAEALENAPEGDFADRGD